MFITWVAHLGGVGLSLSGVLTGTRFIGMVAAVVIGVWLLLNSDRIGTLKALGITMMAFVLLGPVDPVSYTHLPWPTPSSRPSIRSQMATAEWVGPWSTPSSGTRD